MPGAPSGCSSGSADRWRERSSGPEGAQSEVSGPTGRTFPPVSLTRAHRAGRHAPLAALHHPVGRNQASGRLVL